MKMHATVLAGLLAISITRSGFANEPSRDEHVVSPIQCIDEFYDPAMYNWLSYKNSCDLAMKVVFVPNSAGHAGGSMIVKPGQHVSTGRSKNEVDAVAGFAIAVCVDGYLPIGSNGRMWSNARDTYVCKKQ